jgi:hypothetical protein
MRQAGANENYNSPKCCRPLSEEETPCVDCESKPESQWKTGLCYRPLTHLTSGRPGGTVLRTFFQVETRGDLEEEITFLLAVLRKRSFVSP